jgi:splicing factor 45
MATPKQKPQGLPNPYAQGGLPNPYALPTADAGASGDMAEEPAKLEENKKSTGTY